MTQRNNSKFLIFLKFLVIKFVNWFLIMWRTLIFKWSNLWFFPGEFLKGFLKKNLFFYFPLFGFIVCVRIKFNAAPCVVYVCFKCPLGGDNGKLVSVLLIIFALPLPSWCRWRSRLPSCCSACATSSAPTRQSAVRRRHFSRQPARWPALERCLWSSVHGFAQGTQDGLWGFCLQPTKDFFNVLFPRDSSVHPWIPMNSCSPMNSNIASWEHFWDISLKFDYFLVDHFFWNLFH